jgi:hypothetical protein
VHEEEFDDVQEEVRETIKLFFLCKMHFLFNLMFY